MIFTRGLGDDDNFDFGGFVSAVMSWDLLAIPVAGRLLRRR